MIINAKHTHRKVILINIMDKCSVGKLQRLFGTMQSEIQEKYRKFDRVSGIAHPILINVKTALKK
jgi:hypothetical protein